MVRHFLIVSGDTPDEALDHTLRHQAGLKRAVLFLAPSGQTLYGALEIEQLTEPAENVKPLLAL